MRAIALGITGMLLLGSVGCGVPIGVEPADPSEVYATLTSNVLSTGEISAFSSNVLRRSNLAERWEDDPAGALAALHERQGSTRDADRLFALAELSFQRAREEEDPPRYLAASIYAFAFLFPDDPSQAPGPLDPRQRVACDIYNRGIVGSLFFDGKHSLDVETETDRTVVRALPFGRVEVEIDASSLVWGKRRLSRLTSVADLRVRGLRNRYRRGGIGAPLAADTVPLPGEPDGVDYVMPGMRVPVTAILDLPDVERHLRLSRVRGRLFLHAASDGDLVEVAGRMVPVEVENTAALAYTLAESPYWEQELAAFWSGSFVDEASRLTALSPYKPGLIPVVLVHGTASSPARWAEMLNDLTSDPVVAEHFQFWLFSYDTGNPIAYSAAVLRNSLGDLLEALDPEGHDEALKHMVVIGHSQGGLLTRMTAIDTGSSWWNAISSVPLEELGLSAETEETLRDVAFIEPVPEVRRLVYIATPHRGSYLASWGIARLVSSFVTFPGKLVDATQELIAADPDREILEELDGRGGSVGAMDPKSLLVRLLGETPVVAGVRQHSIIPVQGQGPLLELDDGVVEYRSAHLVGVESELVIRSGHSVQAHPEAIEEVRRILRLHLSEIERLLP